MVVRYFLLLPSLFSVHHRFFSIKECLRFAQRLFSDTSAQVGLINMVAKLLPLPRPDLAEFAGLVLRSQKRWKRGWYYLLFLWGAGDAQFRV
jgi:hypothetical protein